MRRNTLMNMPAVDVMPAMDVCCKKVFWSTAFWRSRICNICITI